MAQSPQKGLERNDRDAGLYLKVAYLHPRLFENERFAHE